MLTDRQRIEILLPSQVMLAVLIHGVNDPNHEDAIRCKELLIEASSEPIRDLTDRHREKLLRRR